MHGLPLTCHVSAAQVLKKSETWFPAQVTQPAWLSLLTDPVAGKTMQFSFIKKLLTPKICHWKSHGSLKNASLKNQYWWINWTIIMCLSGYLKIDEQRKCKAHEAAKKGLQRLLKGWKIARKLLFWKQPGSRPSEIREVACSHDFKSLLRHIICVFPNTKR